MATAPLVVQPPFYDPPIRDDASGQQHSQAWTEYHQSVADQLATISSGQGVTDGTNAAPGAIGEYMTATGNAVGLVSAAVTNLASLTLTPGDWDVSGYGVFTAGAGTHSYFGVGIGVIDSNSFATYAAGAFNQVMPTALHRVSISATATVWVVGQAVFTGTMTGTGTINARRAR